MDNLQLARIWLSDRAVYLNRVLWSLQPVPQPGLGTVAVDTRLRLYYDPDFLSGLSVPETVAVLVHEIHHVLRMHADRAPGLADKMGWNIAADAEINDDLPSEGYALPGHPVTPSSLGMEENLTAEEYYAGMEKMGSEVVASCSTVGEGACGSVADGQAKEYELPADDKTNPGMGPLERDLIRRAAAKDILSTAARGTVPSSLKRWAEDHLRSEVDWRKELAVTLRRCLARARGSVDYTYQKPSTRRSASSNGTEYILPSMYAPSPDIAVVVDTSGSIGSQALSQALAEVEGILRKADAAQQGVHLISCDAKAEYVGRVLDIRQVRNKPLTGGGGTDMGEGIRLAETLKAEITVVLTDGYTPWPSTPPRTRVIACLIGSGSFQESKVPDWARVVVVKL